MKLNAKQLRKGIGDRGKSKMKKQDIYIILDNVLDTYNIGSIFRLADAVGAKKIILCGGSETPPNHRIKKASINTTEWVDWEYCDSATEAISKVKSLMTDVQIIAIEQNDNSVSYDKFDYNMPVCLVVGNESNGVSIEALEFVDKIVEIPMFGVNMSLNVMVSLAIVLYEIIEKT